MFSSKSLYFLLLCLGLWSILSWILQSEGLFLFCPWKSGCPSTIYGRDNFPCQMVLLPLWKSIGCRYRGYVCALSSTPLKCVSMLTAGPQGFEDCSFAVGFEIGNCESLTLSCLRIVMTLRTTSHPIRIWGLAFPCLPKRPLGFWWGLHWLCSFLW